MHNGIKTVAVGLVVVLGCTGTEPQRRTTAETARDHSPTGNKNALAIELHLPPKVGRGVPVPLSLVVRNASSHPVALGIGDSATTFDLFVRSTDGEIVWNRMHNRETLTVLKETTIAPGREIRFTDAWTQRTNENTQVGPGTYQVYGTVETVAPEDLRAPPKTLVIGER